MALTATIYNLDTDLADVDRGVYEKIGLRLARQPSETLEYMLTRFLAYCFEYTEGIELTEGVGAEDAPGLHGGSKRAGRAAVYTHRNVAHVLAELNGRNIHRAAEIPVYEFGRGFVEAIAAVVQRRAEVAISITERQLYLDVCGQTFSTGVVEHRIT